MATTSQIDEHQDEFLILKETLPLAAAAAAAPAVLIKLTKITTRLPCLASDLAPPTRQRAHWSLRAAAKQTYRLCRLDRNSLVGATSRGQDRLAAARAEPGESGEMGH